METKIWLAIGFLAQALFSARFLIQWLYSEKHRRSIIPIAFWYFSLAGGSLLLAYAIYQQDPVFIVGQAGGLIVYSRNLYLIVRERRERQHSEPV
ncbi:MAG TPA: lipid-A-disaccharide synthase N-terminal domain-containing protein [Gammaproteobacteria bacterium]|nr:lipid-A-disaccharide synthase N-terminal domain-containing protein [Gammaproteobacteria bacterium]